MTRALIITIVMLLVSCAAPGSREDDKYRQAMREGNYSLTVVEPVGGGPTMAVLDVEGDSYELAPEKGALQRARQKGLSPGEAIISADQSLTGSGVMLKAVTGESGMVIGYEAYSPVSQGPGPPSGPESEAVLLPNLLRIDYTIDPAGRSRIRVITLPLKEPGSLVPPQ